MIVNELIKYLDDWAPPGASWEKDNVGLLVGSGEDSIKNIFLALELNEEVLDEALKKNCNFIFTHHPIIFTPIKKLNFDNDSQAKLISRLIKNDISIFSAHTNLDFTKDGVSFELAKKLKLEKVKFLKNQNSNQYKIVVFVPQNKLDDVANSMFDKGAGIIGEYKYCSFRLTGEGTFQGSSNSNPFIGKKENFEKVNEVRLEVIVDSWNLNKVITSMLKAHPYEEPAYDIYPLKNKNTNYGAGAIGELKTELNVDEFLNYVKKNLSLTNFRYSLGNKNKIKKVAVCGGSGSDLLQDAIQNNADAFITADVKYHSFHDAFNKILLIDAGHYETEIIVLDIVEKKIQSFINNKKEKIKIYKFSKTTNPIKFYKQ
ncbi:MAG: Nif3-like dinuclear metal center hexameric protein [Melioribacteraceae bacterium]|nr:Nif3-like dinuclear metal center hexameric protein [Melioribacteraceae bacterium]